MVGAIGLAARAAQGSTLRLAVPRPPRATALLRTPALAAATGARLLSGTPAAQGVTKELIKAGDGVHFPQKGDTVTMHYHGTLTNGTKFDSSIDRGRPFVTKIGVGQVIRGWDEGVPQMSLGEKAKLHISYDYAYGEGGYPGVIPPKADLIFEVELLKIN